MAENFDKNYTPAATIQRRPNWLLT